MHSGKRKIKIQTGLLAVQKFMISIVDFLLQTLWIIVGLFWKIKKKVNRVYLFQGASEVQRRVALHCLHFED